MNMNALVAPDSRASMRTLLMLPVREARLKPPLTVAAGESLRQAARLMDAHDLAFVLVAPADGGALGIATGTDLRREVLVGECPPETAVAQVATFPALAVPADHSLLDALLLFNRSGFHRLLVEEDGVPLGVLEEGEILRHLASHADTVSLQIEAAAHLGDLAPAHTSLLRLIAALAAEQVRVDHIAREASHLTGQVFARVFALLAPPSLASQICFVALGSEGRGEQILPTDQDNAFILRDARCRDEALALGRAVSAALLELGYPECPGNIMVRNPEWVLTVDELHDKVRDWVLAPSEGNMLNLAILLDAHALAGDVGLLAEVRTLLFDLCAGNNAFLARFAAAALLFPGALSWFNRLVGERGGEHKGWVDLKKRGVFPLVHGLRALALEARVEATGTLSRLAALKERSVLSAAFAAEVEEAFLVLSRMRLVAGLANAEAGGDDRNHLDPMSLNRVEADLLTAALETVESFKAWLRQHYRLDLLGL
ncbi:hypothetical protein OTERR_27080 [Oryzomicrobium terrae]|uniref:CBS domain-containing protein n=2 Tax=Oryzomicrobium terrae TaxID=1735038 RepID=A0A5C1EBV6_9RHOO|nr:hypothetical protein OTERR_27080 [Oryzomicrobium terrae]